MAKESPARPFYTVLILAFVCSALVSGAAIGLRPMQEANRRNDMRINILRAAGLYEPGKSVEELFSVIDTKIIELKSGEFIPEDQISPAAYNQLKASLNNNLSRPLNKDEDKAGIRRLEKYSLVYLVRNKAGIEQIILPVRGKGLWSTMYGYISIDGDLTTIRGISFYQHGETPGLGGEIENQNWLSSWQGKKMYSDDKISLHIVKGKAQTKGEAALYEIDGLSGATITGQGVNDLMHFWFGEHGFKPFFNRLKKDGVING